MYNTYTVINNILAWSNVNLSSSIYRNFKEELNKLEKNKLNSFSERSRKILFKIIFKPRCIKKLEKGEFDLEVLQNFNTS